MPFGRFNSMPQKNLPENQALKKLAFPSLFHQNVRLCCTLSDGFPLPLLHFALPLFTIPQSSASSTPSFHPLYFQIVALPCFSIPILFNTMHHHPGGGTPPLFPSNHLLFNDLLQKQHRKNPTSVPLFNAILSLQRVERDPALDTMGLLFRGIRHGRTVA